MEGKDGEDEDEISVVGFWNGYRSEIGLFDLPNSIGSSLGTKQSSVLRFHYDKYAYMSLCGQYFLLQDSVACRRGI